MSKCNRHGIDYVYSPPKDFGLKASNWVCPECKKEQSDFFSSIASQPEVGLIPARAVVAQHDEHLIDLLNVLRCWYRTPANQVTSEMKAHKLYPSCCGSERQIWDAVDAAIAKAGG